MSVIKRAVYVMLAGLIFCWVVSPGMAAQTTEPEYTITWWITPWRIRVPGMDPAKSPTGEEFCQYISEEFMKLHPNVQVKYEIVTVAGRLEKLTAAMYAGNPPDLCWHQGNPNPEWVPMMEPIEASLTDEDWEDFIPYTLETGKIGDHYYMWPWNNSNNGMGNTLLLNVEIFKERGVPLPPLPDRSWTIDEFLSCAQALTFDRDGDGVVDVYAISLPAKSVENMLAWLHLFGARLLNDETTEFTLNSPEGIAALQFLVDLVYKYKVAVPGGEAMGVYDAIDLFHQGKTAIGYGGIYEIGRIDRYLKEGRIDKPLNVAIAQFPHVPEVGPVAYQVNGGFLVFKQPDQKKRKLVMELARFITNTQNMVLLEDLLYITSRKSVNDRLTFEQVQAYADVRTEVEVYLRAIDHGIPYFGPAHVNTKAAMPYLEAAIQAALSLEKTPKDALDEFVKNANRVVFGK